MKRKKRDSETLYSYLEIGLGIVDKVHLAIRNSGPAPHTPTQWPRFRIVLRIETDRKATRTTSIGLHMPKPSSIDHTVPRIQVH